MVCLTFRLDAVVVVSMMEVEVSERLAVALDCGVMDEEEGASPTRRTLPSMRTLGSPSTAMLKTFRPL